MNIYRKISWVILIAPLLLAGDALADKKDPSATLVIDETQVMAILGGDLGGGTLLFGDESYGLKTGGLKLGGLGVHKIHLVGYVYELNDVADFPGVYFSAQAGFTVGDASKQGLWLKNSNGVTLHLKTSGAKGLALSTGVEGFKITMK